MSSQQNNPGQEPKQEAREPFMPEPTFTTFILSLASTGLVQLGESPDPLTGKTAFNGIMAKHTIAVLAMLRDKTAGNLTHDEKEILDALLYELHMKFVLKSR